MSGSIAARTQHLPRVRLGHLPTPVEPLRNAELAIPGLRAEVLVKRDDLTGFSTAGNKLRLLEFLLGDAIDRGAHTIVGCGPTTSNFVASLAQASATLGRACEIYIPGPITRHPAITLAEAAGAQVRSVPLTRHEIDAFVAERVAELTHQGTPAYGIPRGGATPVGALGYALAAEEIVGQLADRGDVVIVIPAGSCASSAGLLAGLTVLDAPARVVAVSTNRQIDKARDVLVSLSTAVVSMLGGATSHPEERLTIVDRADGANAVDLAAVRSVLRHSGIVAADHYGPATLAEVMSAAREPAAETVVWWHTGGVLGLPRLLGLLSDFGDVTPGG
jgi:1-aminocyclopropane-1-carboxylate deaminase/D-cysteine desulfhydrase-like pyridoxal-dependent ACC family enzyme